MKYILPAVLFLSLILILPGCSTSQETQKEEGKQEVKEDSVYVFDEVTEPEKQAPAVIETPAPPYYIVQIGAFTTKEKADAFAVDSRARISNKVEVRYSESVNLYVVQVVPFLKQGLMPNL